MNKYSQLQRNQNHSEIIKLLLDVFLNPLNSICYFPEIVNTLGYTTHCYMYISYSRELIIIDDENNEDDDV